VSAPLQIGRYVLHGEIASGGMASVHYGRLVGTGGFAKTVAIKRLHRQLARTDSFRKMILEEGRLAARVRHPNVVPPLDVLAENGELLLVMEYVHGEALSRLVRAARAAGEKVPLAVGAAIVANVLHGLHAAHEAKDEAGNPLDIVHRDVSPQNVIVGVDGNARVIDFGIAKAVTSEGNTTAGTIKGKVPYLAPEQLEGEPATKRTDIYAAAVVFWEVLAGKRLFDGEDDSEVLRQIMTMPVPVPSSINPSVPRAVDDVVLRAIARSPADRFATARDMALALEAAVHLATASVVGAWAERLAATTLAERAAKIAEVEKAPPPSDSLDDIAVSKPPSTGRRAPPASTRPPPPSTSGPPSTRPPPSRATRPPPSSTAAPSRPPPLPAPRNSAPPPPPAIIPPAPPAPAIAFAATAHAADPGVLPIPPPPPPKAGRRASSPDLSRAAAAAPHAVPRSSSPAFEPRTVIYEPPPLPEPEFIEGVRALGAPPPEPAPTARTAPPASSRTGAPAPLSPPAAGVLKKPETAIANVAWLPDKPRAPAPKAGSWVKTFFAYLAAFIGIALLVAWMFAPALVRAWLVTSAKERGIVLTIERVDVSRKVVHLVDVKAEAKAMPGVAVRAGTLDIGLRWLLPERVTLDDALLELDGPYTEIAARVEAWRSGNAQKIDESLTGIRVVEVTSGRVDWRGVIGAETSALVENITLDVTKTGIRPIGADYKLSAPLFTMKLGAAPAGPWQIDLDRQGILSRAVIHLDPSGMYPATVTRTSSDDGSVTLTLAVPPTRLSDLRIPGAVFGGLATDRTRLEARGQLDIVATQPAPGGPPKPSRDASGQLVFAASALAVFPSAQVDLALDLPIAGDVGKPVPLSATLAVAPSDASGGATTAVTSAVVTGTLDLSGRAPKIDLTGKSGSLPCAKPAPASATTAAPTKEKDASSTAIRVAASLTLDDLHGSKVSFAPSVPCTPRLTK